jgi:DNA-binding winged helix-turn-helix (wHTH) protein
MTPNLIPSSDPLMDTGTPKELVSSPRYVRFGPFLVDRQRQQVSRGGTRLRLQGKVYHVLVVLIEKQGEVVTREELRQALWPEDTHVNYDANVNTTVNKLRQALGESTEKPTYIETIPRKGYSFIGGAEFAELPFPFESATSQAAADSASADIVPSAQTGPRKWLFLTIVTLILAGVLLGAGAAMLWMARFAPKLQH